MRRKFWVAVTVASFCIAPALAAFGPGFKVVPNPVRADQGQTEAVFQDISGGGELKIFNAAGRLVLETTIAASATEYRWNLKNSDSKNVAAGVYVYVLELQGQTRTGKIGIIR